MVFQSREFQLAQEFLNALILEGPTKYQSDFFLYRGVGNGSGPDEHHLIPSALRQDRFPELVRLAGSSPMPDDYAREAAKEEWIQARCEAKILGSFFRYADAQGLPMPEITSSIRQALQISGTSDTHFNRVVQTASRWPPDELLPLAGQAQHYGLPTRLLDWSRDPWVAAYFAAKSGMESLKSDGSLNVDTSSIAVWILNADLLDHEKRLARPQEPMDIPLTLVTAPAGTNPNLRAQHGMFTVWRPLFINRAKQQVDRRPLEVLLSEAFIGKEPTLPLLYKFMLPLNQVSDLWKIIRRNIVNAARMFPDFSGAAEAVREDSKYK